MHRPFLKNISALLIMVFLAQDISWAAQEVSANHSPKIQLSSETSKTIESYKGKLSKQLILIQDAHTNLSAQKNLAKIIEELVTRHHVRTVFTEGGSQDDSLTSLRPLADKKIRERVSRRYLMQGVMSGDEYLSLSTDLDLKIRGVEDMSLYKKNLEYYRSVAHSRESVWASLHEIKKRVDTLKRQLYPGSLLALDEAVSGFEDKKIDFTAYFDALTEASRGADVNLLGYPQFLSLGALKDKEVKLDLQKTGEEQSLLYQNLQRIDPSRALDLKNKAMSVQKVRYQTGASSAFYKDLVNLAKKHGLSAEHLEKYVDYLTQYEALHIESLMDETQRLEDEIFARGLTGDTAIFLHKADEYLKNLRKLFSLQATRDEVESYKESRKEDRFKTVSLIAFVNRALYDLGREADVMPYQDIVEKELKSVEGFYETTRERDQAFVRTALEKMGRDDLTTAALVAGGYHTGNLKRILEEQGVSYIVVSPLVTDETDQKRYEKLLLSQFAYGTPGAAGPMLNIQRSKGFLSLIKFAERPGGWMGDLRQELASQGARLAQDSMRSRLADPNAEKVRDLMRQITGLDDARIMEAILSIKKDDLKNISARIKPLSHRRRLIKEIKGGPIQLDFSSKMILQALVFDGIQVELLAKLDHANTVLKGIADLGELGTPSALDLIVQVYERTKAEPRFKIQRAGIQALEKNKPFYEQQAFQNPDTEQYLSKLIQGLKRLSPEENDGNDQAIASMIRETASDLLDGDMIHFADTSDTPDTTRIGSFKSSEDDVNEGRIIIDSAGKRLIYELDQAGDWRDGGHKLTRIQAFGTGARLAERTNKRVNRWLLAAPLLALGAYTPQFIRTRVNRAALKKEEHRLAVREALRPYLEGFDLTAAAEVIKAEHTITSIRIAITDPLNEAELEKMTQQVLKVQANSPAKSYDKIFLTEDRIRQLVRNRQVLTVNAVVGGEYRIVAAIFFNVSKRGKIRKYAQISDSKNHDIVDGDTLYDFWVITDDDYKKASAIPFADTLIHQTAELAERAGWVVMAYSRPGDLYKRLRPTEKRFIQKNWDRRIMRAYRAHIAAQHLLKTRFKREEVYSTKPFEKWLSTKYKVDLDGRSKMAKDLRSILTPSFRRTHIDLSRNKDLTQLIGLWFMQFASEVKGLDFMDPALGKLHTRLGGHLVAIYFSRDEDENALGMNAIMSYEAVEDLEGEINRLMFIMGYSKRVSGARLAEIDQELQQAKARNKSYVGTVMFHDDGIGTAPTVAALNAAGILQLLTQGSQEKPVTMAQISDLSRQQKGGANAGYLFGAMQILERQGFLKSVGRSASNDMRYWLTDEGRVMAKLAGSYTKAVQFIPAAISMDEFLFSKPRDPPMDAGATEKFAELIADLKAELHIPSYPDESTYENVRQQIIRHVEGLVMGPILVQLRWQVDKGFMDPTKPISIDTLNGNYANLDLAFELLIQKHMVEETPEGYLFTPYGLGALAYAWSYGVPVSYLPTFETATLNTLLFGSETAIRELFDRRGSKGEELLVNRAMNVAASGAAHETYFEDMKPVLDHIFNSEDLANQPRGLADMGSGNGAFLKFVYEYVRDNTLRGKNLARYPLDVVGADFNLAAREATDATLTKAGIAHMVIEGNINDPIQYEADLAKVLTYSPEELLHLRSFLDHNRPFVGVKDAEAARERKTDSRAAVAWRGRAIPAGEVYQNLYEHLVGWKKLIAKHGLLMIELLTLDPSVTAQSLGRSLDTGYFATHVYSDQILVELPYFLEVVKEAGLKIEDFKKYAKTDELTTVIRARFVAEPETVEVGARLAEAQSNGPEMDVTIHEDEHLAQVAATAIADEIVKAQSDKIANVVLAYGKTQIPVLKRLIEDTRIDWNKVRIFHGDEAVGLGKDDLGSGANFFEEYLVGPLRAKGYIFTEGQNLFYIDTKRADLQNSIFEYVKTLADLGGADVMTLGIGRNGHIYFNEPGTSFEAEAHIADLVGTTLEDNPAAKNDPRALTLGPADVKRAKKVFMLITGTSKTEPVYKFLEGPIDIEVPASFLRTLPHEQVRVILDRSASVIYRASRNFKALSIQTQRNREASIDIVKLQQITRLLLALTLVAVLHVPMIFSRSEVVFEGGEFAPALFLPGRWVAEASIADPDGLKNVGTLEFVLEGDIRPIIGTWMTIVIDKDGDVFVLKPTRVGSGGTIRIPLGEFAQGVDLISLASDGTKSLEGVRIRSAQLNETPLSLWGWLKLKIFGPARTQPKKNIANPSDRIASRMGARLSVRQEGESQDILSIRSSLEQAQRDRASLQAELINARAKDDVGAIRRIQTAIDDKASEIDRLGRTLRHALELEERDRKLIQSDRDTDILAKLASLVDGLSSKDRSVVWQQIKAHLISNKALGPGPATLVIRHLSENISDLSSLEDLADVEGLSWNPVVAESLRKGLEGLDVATIERPAITAGELETTTEESIEPEDPAEITQEDAEAILNNSARMISGADPAVIHMRKAEWDSLRRTVSEWQKRTNGKYHIFIKERNKMSTLLSVVHQRANDWREGRYSVDNLPWSSLFLINHTLHPNGFSDVVPTPAEFAEFKAKAFDEAGNLRPEVKEAFEKVAAKRLKRGDLSYDPASAYEAVMALRNKQAHEEAERQIIEQKKREDELLRNYSLEVVGIDGHLKAARALIGEQSYAKALPLYIQVAQEISKLEDRVIASMDEAGISHQASVELARIGDQAAQMQKEASDELVKALNALIRLHVAGLEQEEIRRLSNGRAADMIDAMKNAFFARYPGLEQRLLAEAGALFTEEIGNRMLVNVPKTVKPVTPPAKPAKRVITLESAPVAIAPASAVADDQAISEEAEPGQQDGSEQNVGPTPSEPKVLVRIEPTPTQLADLRDALDASLGVDVMSGLITADADIVDKVFQVVAFERRLYDSSRLSRISRLLNISGKSKSEKLQLLDVLKRSVMTTAEKSQVSLYEALESNVKRKKEASSLLEIQDQYKPKIIISRSDAGSIEGERADEITSPDFRLEFKYDDNGFPVDVASVTMYLAEDSFDDQYAVYVTLLARIKMILRLLAANTNDPLYSEESIKKLLEMKYFGVLASWWIVKNRNQLGVSRDGMYVLYFLTVASTVRAVFHAEQFDTQILNILGRDTRFGSEWALYMHTFERIPARPGVPSTMTPLEEMNILNAKIDSPAKIMDAAIHEPVIRYWIDSVFERLGKTVLPVGAVLGSSSDAAKPQELSTFQNMITAVNLKVDLTRILRKGNTAKLPTERQTKAFIDAYELTRSLPVEKSYISTILLENLLKGLSDRYADAEIREAAMWVSYFMHHNIQAPKDVKHEPPFLIADANAIDKSSGLYRSLLDENGAPDTWLKPNTVVISRSRPEGVLSEEMPSILTVVDLERAFYYASNSSSDRDDFLYFEVRGGAKYVLARSGSSKTVTNIVASLDGRVIITARERPNASDVFDPDSEPKNIDSTFVIRDPGFMGARLSEATQLPVVDANGNPTGRVIKQSERYELNAGEYVHTAIVFFLRRNGDRVEVLAQHRDRGISPNLNYWDATAAGRREVGEDIVRTAKRELYEESRQKLRFASNKLKEIGSENMALEALGGKVNTRFTYYVHWVELREDRWIQRRMIKGWHPTTEVYAWKWRSLDEILDVVQADQKISHRERQINYSLAYGAKALQRHLPATVQRGSAAGARLTTIIDVEQKGYFTPDGRDILLVAEDSPNIRVPFLMLLQRHLRNAGKENVVIVMVDDLEAAFKAYDTASKSGTLKYVITDNRYPTGSVDIPENMESGTHFYHFVKQDSKAPIFMMSSGQRPSSVSRQEFADKGFDTEKMIQAVVNSLGARLSAKGQGDFVNAIKIDHYTGGLARVASKQEALKVLRAILQSRAGWIYAARNPDAVSQKTATEGFTISVDHANIYSYVMLEDESYEWADQGLLDHYAMVVNAAGWIYLMSPDESDENRQFLESLPKISADKLTPATAKKQAQGSELIYHKERAAKFLFDLIRKDNFPELVIRIQNSYTTISIKVKDDWDAFNHARNQMMTVPSAIVRLQFDHQKQELKISAASASDIARRGARLAKKTLSEHTILKELAQTEDSIDRLLLAEALFADTRPIASGLLDAVYVLHDMKVRSLVNPLGQAKAALYKGAGADISNFLLSVNTPYADFEAYYHGLSDLDLESIDPRLLRRGRARDYRHAKFSSGFGLHSRLDDIEDILIALTSELDAMEVDFSTIEVDSDERGYPRLSFLWSYRMRPPQRYFISFVDASSHEPVRYQDQYSVYYQRAGMDIPEGYMSRPGQESFMVGVAARLEPDGFFVTDDFISRPSAITDDVFVVDYGSYFPFALPEVPVAHIDLYEDAVRRVRHYLDDWDTPDTYFYGWKVRIRQNPEDKKPPLNPVSGVRESPAAEADRWKVGDWVMPIDVMSGKVNGEARQIVKIEEGMAQFAGDDVRVSLRVLSNRYVKKDEPAPRGARLSLNQQLKGAFAILTSPDLRSIGVEIEWLPGSKIRFALPYIPGTDINKPFDEFARAARDIAKIDHTTFDLPSGNGGGRIYTFYPDEAQYEELKAAAGIQSPVLEAEPLQDRASILKVLGIQEGQMDLGVGKIATKVMGDIAVIIFNDRVMKLYKRSQNGWKMVDGGVAVEPGIHEDGSSAPVLFGIYQVSGDYRIVLVDGPVSSYRSPSPAMSAEHANKALKPVRNISLRVFTLSDHKLLPIQRLIARWVRPDSVSVNVNDNTVQFIDYRGHTIRYDLATGEQAGARLSSVNQIEEGDAVSRLAEAVIRVARHVHDGRYDQIIVAGNSADWTLRAFSQAWDKLYAGQTMPKVVILNEQENLILYRNPEIPDVAKAHTEAKKLLLEKAVLDPRRPNILFLEDIVLSGSKYGRVRRLFNELPSRKLKFAFFVSAGERVLDKDAMIGETDMALYRFLHPADDVAVAKDEQFVRKVLDAIDQGSVSLVGARLARSTKFDPKTGRGFFYANADRPDVVQESQRRMGILEDRAEPNSNRIQQVDDGLDDTSKIGARLAASNNVSLVAGKLIPMIVNKMVVLFAFTKDAWAATRVDNFDRLTGVVVGRGELGAIRKDDVTVPDISSSEILTREKTDLHAVTAAIPANLMNGTHLKNVEVPVGALSREAAEAFIMMLSNIHKSPYGARTRFYLEIEAEQTGMWKMLLDGRSDFIFTGSAPKDEGVTIRLVSTEQETTLSTDGIINLPLGQGEWIGQAILMLAAAAGDLLAPSGKFESQFLKVTDIPEAFEAGFNSLSTKRAGVDTIRDITTGAAKWQTFVEYQLKPVLQQILNEARTLSILRRYLQSAA